MKPLCTGLPHRAKRPDLLLPRERHAAYCMLYTENGQSSLRHLCPSLGSEALSTTITNPPLVEVSLMNDQPMLRLCALKRCTQELPLTQRVLRTMNQSRRFLSFKEDGSDGRRQSVAGIIGRSGRSPVTEELVLRT